MNHMTYIVHEGTGTIIAVDECVIVDVPDEMLDAFAKDGGDDYFDDQVVIDLAREKGRPINTTDLMWGNTVAYSPTALREEALAMIDGGYAEGDAELEKLLTLVWMTATDDDLNIMASYILDSDDVWESYRGNLIEGAQWLLTELNKKENP